MMTHSGVVSGAVRSFVLAQTPWNRPRSRAGHTVYLNYFGLSEASFSITPDPQYLFLSEQHREALAHLLYGAGENGGFVMLTGEVGTGKTTICRAFLEQTPERVDVALVLNPAMTAIELMHAICQEFGVATPQYNDSVKVLVDRLNAYLLDAHARGRHPVLVIDEAQNLRPRVLEQVRLLTNLETSKQKLLQIFLIGQPELREILASPELRQLNQRITARFHLRPLSARETAAYIDHRITVAGVERPLFSAAALREVHRRSRGVPRLINLICDRSLLGAAVSRRMQVTPAIVRRAAAELLGDKPPQPRQTSQPRLAMAAALVLALGLGSWIGASGLLEQGRQRLEQARTVWTALQAGDGATADLDGSEGGPSLASNADAEDRDAGSVGAEVEAAPNDRAAALTDASAGEEYAKDAPRVAAEASTPEIAPDADPAHSIPRIALARITPQVPEAEIAALTELMLDGKEPIAELLELWGYPPDRADDCMAVRDLGLECERSRERWSDLRLFDRPAALKLMIDGQQRYVMITGIDDEYAVVQRGDIRRRVAIAELDERWSGDLLMLWRLPPGGAKMIGPGTVGETVQWLRERLASLPDATLTETTGQRYDAALRNAVREFQAGRGLAVDGVAGPRTLILLNNALADSELPRLTQSQTP